MHIHMFRNARDPASAAVAASRKAFAKPCGPDSAARPRSAAKKACVGALGGTDPNEGPNWVATYSSINIDIDIIYIYIYTHILTYIYIEMYI